MDEKIELLVCLGAATAANCIPCFEYYFKKLSAAGVPIEEIEKAVELACKVKTGAGIAMINSIRDITRRNGDSDQAKGEADHPCCR